MPQLFNLEQLSTNNSPSQPLSWQEALVLKLHLKTSPARSDLENQFLAFSLESGLWRGIHTHPVDDWQLFGTLCEPENGGKTIMGRLTVMGKPISPQRYLGEWRRTLENPATPETLLRRGLIPYGHCTRPTHPLKSPWHPGQSFETAYENCQAPEGYRFDLSQTHAAQAFYDITEWSPTGPERGSHLYPVSWTSLERTGFDVREASRRSGS